MNRFLRFSYLRIVAAAVMIALPLSAFAESRPDGRTDLERLAAELERVFGRGSVVVERSGSDRSRSEEPPLRRDVETQSATIATDAYEALDAMNRERARQGLAPLRANPDLMDAAAMKAGHMQRNRYFDHVSPDGRRPVDFAHDAGYRYSMLGENLAIGFRSGDAVVAGWMRSPGHRANILGDYVEVGIASLGGSPVRGYGGDTWVAIYGRP